MTLDIRPARPADLPFLLSLAPRLAEFGLPPWRAPTHVVDAERRALERALEARSPDAPILVAEDGGTPVGFVYLETHIDYFTGRSHAHIAVIAVSAAAQGSGVGRALLDAAEGWARERGHPFISLNVFAENVRARRVYERRGYGPETLRYVKSFETRGVPDP